MSAKDNKNEHFKVLMDILSRQFDKFDKLRLAILFALRYENDKPTMSLVRGKLKSEGLSPELIEIVDYVLKYAGKSERVGDLFEPRDFVGKLSKKMKQAFKDVPNVFTQHEPYISNLIDALNKGKLKESEFGSKSLYKSNDRPSDLRPNEIIIFIIGGVTYEEAKVVADLNRKGACIVLGGTNVINSKLFLGEITDFEKEQREIQINVSNEEGVGKKSQQGYGKLD